MENAEHSSTISRDAINLDFPWWPPETPMGEEHARELVATVKPHAPAALAAAKAWLADHAPNAEPTAHSSTVAEIARLSLDPTMRGICIGVVSVPGSSGRPVIVGIAVTREGNLAITTPVEGGAQEWTVLGEGFNPGAGQATVIALGERSTR